MNDDHLITDLIIEVFRLNGRLLVAGDALVGDLGLTSARWQVMGAIAAAPNPLSVAHLARSMGLTRQGVQRIANELERSGLIRFAPNPLHRRAKLAVFTATGRALYDKALARQRPWAERLAADLAPRDLNTVKRVIATLRERLDEMASSADDVIPPS